MALDYTTNEPEFEDISDEAKDFIAKLIVADQEQRLSADEALDHAWLQPAANDEEVQKSRRVSMIQTSPKLTDVMARLKWQKCTSVIVACSHLKH